MTSTTQDKSIPKESPVRPDWLPYSEYPFQLRSIDLAGHAVTYIDEGKGPVLLFVHTGLWSFVFRDVIERLRADFRTLTLDFPGSGLSPDAQDGDPLIEESSDILEQFITTLGLTDITLVAHDLGGPVGFGLAARRPDLIKAMVPTNTFGWNPEGKGLRGMLRVMSSSPVAALNRFANFIPRVTVTRFGIGRQLSREGKQAFLGPYRDRSRRRRFSKLTRDVLNIKGYMDAIERAQGTTLNDRPVLTIFGERNDPFGFQHRYRETFSNVRGVVVPKGMHFPMMDDPDLFSEALLQWWLDEVATP